jgi:hypothetical protein
MVQEPNGGSVSGDMGQAFDDMEKSGEGEAETWEIVRATDCWLTRVTVHVGASSPTGPPT